MEGLSESTDVNVQSTCMYTGAPNENIVQNHLNIALLNVFQYLNGRYRHIFIPQKFFICSDFLAESLVIRKLQRSKFIPSRKFQPEKRLPKILGDLLRVKIRQKWAIIPFFRSSKILGEAGKQEILQQLNVTKILDLKSSSEQIFSENCRWVPLCTAVHIVCLQCSIKKWSWQVFDQ